MTLEFEFELEFDRKMLSIKLTLEKEIGRRIVEEGGGGKKI